MVCAVCGEILALEVVQSEAQWQAHRLLKHQPPAVQALGVLALTIGGFWGLEQAQNREGMTGMKARSRSDVALAEAVTRETGLPTTPWQIERWRQGGLLQPGGRSFPGSGSETTYSLKAHAQAVELAKLSRCYRRQRDIALAPFAKGLYVSDPVLKRALVGVFERVDKWIGPAKTDDELDDIDHRAQPIAKWSKRTKQGRMLQRRMHGRAASPEDMVAGVYYTVLHIFKTGEVTSDEGFDEFLDATGLRGLFTEQLNGAGPIAPEGSAGLQAFLEQLTLQGVAGRVQKSSMDELRESRDLMAALFPFFKNFATAAHHLQQAPTGLGLMMMEHLDVDDASRGTWAAIGLVILPLMRTSGALLLLEQVRANAAFYQGLAELARLVPPEVVPAMRRGILTVWRGCPRETEPKSRRLPGRSRPSTPRSAEVIARAR